MVISKWTFFAFLILSGLIGLSFAVFRNCNKCNKRNPTCNETVACPPEQKYCSQLVNNGVFIFKGCGALEDSSYKKNFPDGTCAVKLVKEWKEDKTLGRNSAAEALNDALELLMELTSLQDSDSLKMCFCDSDYCNNEDQLNRIYNGGSESGSGSGKGSGTSPSVSGLMLGSSLAVAVFFLARCMYGF